MSAIRAIVAAVSPKPVNVVIGPASGPVPIADLQAAGVKRISLGVAPYKHAMGALETALRKLADGDVRPIASGVASGTVEALLEGSGTRAG
jgi:2-methylisocitrate lyase-like PEP mutase family enzyme